MTDDEIEKRVPRMLRDLEAIGTRDRVETFVSCWHESPVESEAMWRLYGTSYANAIAIKTTHDRLYRALGRSPDIPIGRVEYIDFRRAFAGVNGAFWRKRLAFQHEREVRAVIRDRSTKATFKAVPCDLDVLIEGIYVSPQADSWFAGIVDEISGKYGVGVRVSPSELADPHFF